MADDILKRLTDIVSDRVVASGLCGPNAPSSSASTTTSQIADVPCRDDVVFLALWFSRAIELSWGADRNLFWVVLFTGRYGLFQVLVS